MKKKNYKQPEMKVVQVKTHRPLVDSDPTGGGEAREYRPTSWDED